MTLGRVDKSLHTTNGSKEKIDGDSLIVVIHSLEAKLLPAGVINQIMDVFHDTFSALTAKNLALIVAN